MWTDEPGAPGSEAHSTIEYALSGSLCTNDILFPAIEMVSRSPGRSAMPLPSFATALSPSSRHSRRGCGHPSAFCHAVKFRGSALPQDFRERHALSSLVQSDEKRTGAWEDPSPLLFETTPSTTLAVDRGSRIRPVGRVTLNGLLGQLSEHRS